MLLFLGYHPNKAELRYIPGSGLLCGIAVLSLRGRHLTLLEMCIRVGLHWVGKNSVLTCTYRHCYSMKPVKRGEIVLFSLEKCAECSLALVCGGGCRYPTLLRGEKLCTPLCTTAEKMMVDFLEYWYEKQNESCSS